MNTALISIIIPCYNAEKFIADTINAVCNQSYKNIEIIVLNDGSTDNSLQKIQGVNDYRITLIDKKNTGVSDTRNQGFLISKGTYILFLDSDDIISEKYIESAINIMNTEPKIDFCTYHIEHIDEHNNKINIENKRGTYNNISYEIAAFLHIVSACPSAYIYKKKSLEKYQIKFAENLKSPEDRHFLFQVGKHLNGILVDASKATLNYRINQNSLSHTISKNLLLMQEIFYLQTIKDNLLDGEPKKIFIRKMSYQLTLTFIKIFNPSKAIKYLFLYLNSFLP
jgi:teichuronic acid biosynthesis glycosyltransferase TuaG